MTKKEFQHIKNQYNNGLIYLNMVVTMDLDFLLPTRDIQFIDSENLSFMDNSKSKTFLIKRKHIKYITYHLN